jgi:hypothetical protein
MKIKLTTTDENKWETVSYINPVYSRFQKI